MRARSFNIVADVVAEKISYKLLRVGIIPHR